ncbi:MAG: TolC family protein [Bryobacteraceae bacterium]|nr:TolC family protein [Bryobacteraceae bacterium]
MRVSRWIVWLLPLPGAWGQPAPRLTLDQAVQEAILRNQALMAERANIDIARARQITASLRPNPVVTASAQTLNLFGAPYNADSPLGPNAFTLHTDLTVETAGKRQRRIGLAREEVALSESSFRESLRQLIAEVQASYVDVQLARENLALARQTLESFQKLVSINEARLKAGDLAEVELERSRVALLQVSAAEQQARLRLAEAKARLRLALGRKEDSGDFDVEEAFRDGPIPAAPSEAVARALKQRPDLEAQRIAVARAEADLRLQRANARVDYTVGTEVSRQWAFGIAGNSMGFSVSVPLPVFHRNQGEIARAGVEVEQARRRVAAAELAVESGVVAAWQRCVSHGGLVRRIEQEMLERARRVLDTTRYSYERGEASLVELLDAQRAFNEAMQTYNEARANYARSLFELESATGDTVQGKP